MEAKDLSLATANVPLKINANNGVHWSWEVICNVDMKLDAPVANKRTREPEGPD